jgi:hypothetical protein
MALQDRGSPLLQYLAQTQKNLTSPSGRRVGHVIVIAQIKSCSARASLQITSLLSRKYLRKTSST